MAPAPTPNPAHGSPVVVVEPAKGEPIAVTNTNNGVVANATTGGDGAGGGDGWGLEADGFGVKPMRRADALAKIAASPVRVLVQAGTSFEECSGMGGTHVLFTVSKSSGSKPFVAATLGGHGSMLQGVFPPGQLYVAGVRVGKLTDLHKGSGWCLDEMGPTDAAVIAVVPVRDEAEAFRVLRKVQ